MRHIPQQLSFAALVTRFPAELLDALAERTEMPVVLKQLILFQSHHKFDVLQRIISAVRKDRSEIVVWMES